MAIQGYWSGLLLALGLVLGCNDLSEFKTSRNTTFRGEVVGSDSDPDQSSFIRQGFVSHTKMELQFDPYATSVSQSDSDDAQPSPSTNGRPGRVHTYACPPENRECDADEGSVGPFDHDRLEPIDNLAHDSLSEYTFPGGGRLRNYMFNVRFDTHVDADGGTTLARSAMLFISLMDSGKIEVRAMAPSALASDGRTEQAPALFGVFVLDRQSR
ncbi:MAG TPA: hypothetical protein VJV78_05010 [Polyangiales bacterium]|nr:hypothetical protein [Polyangiales bacterium]